MSNDQTLESITPAGGQIRRATQVQVGVFILGIATSVLLVTHGLLLISSSGVSPMAAVVFLPIFAMVMANAPISEAPARRRMIYYTLLPVAGGLVAVTLVFGNAFFPGAAAWWVPASLVSSIPFFWAG